MDELNPLAVVTGASSGIGYEPAMCCVAAEGCDLVVAADEAKIAEAASVFRSFGAKVSDVQTDLATREGGGRAHGRDSRHRQAAIAHVLPAGVSAELHRSKAAPGTATK
jgi:short-subunit dehydrogenase